MLEDKSALVVENDAHSLVAISSILRDLGIRFKRNTTGLNVVEQLSAMNPRPDFVLLDIDLPHDEAFLINRRIQSDPTLHEIPVVALGAVIDFATQQRLLRDGFATFTTKPVPRRQFADLIRRILSGDDGSPALA